MKTTRLFIIATVLGSSLAMTSCTEVESLESEEVLNIEEKNVQGVKDGEIKNTHI